MKTLLLLQTLLLWLQCTIGLSPQLIVPADTGKATLMHLFENTFTFYMIYMIFDVWLHFKGPVISNFERASTCKVVFAGLSNLCVMKRIAFLWGFREKSQFRSKFEPIFRLPTFFESGPNHCNGPWTIFVWIPGLKFQIPVASHLLRKFKLWWTKTLGHTSKVSREDSTSLFRNEYHADAY